MAVAREQERAGEGGDALDLSPAEVVTDPAAEPLLDTLWREAGRGGARPEHWRPFDGSAIAARAIREAGGGRFAGLAVVRPAQGMDSIDLLYARPGPDREALIDRLVRWAGAALSAFGLTRIVYAPYGYWRAEVFPTAIARAYHRNGFGSFRGVYLAHPLDPPPRPLAPPAGYAARPFADGDVEEAADMMLRSPEPGAIYWDRGLCHRSIQGAAAPGRPMFPEGLGQVVLGPPAGIRRRRPIVAFALATVRGYVNHVYTLPEHRQRGLAAVVLTRVLDALRARGLGRATILTHDTNPGAVRLYERLGFSVQFTYPQFYLRR